MARETVADTRKRFNDSWKTQCAARQEREEVILRKKLDDAKEDFIENSYLFEQFLSKRCWRTVEVARSEWARIPNDTQKLKAMKEKILI